MVLFRNQKISLLITVWNMETPFLGCHMRSRDRKFRTASCTPTTIMWFPVKYEEKSLLFEFEETSCKLHYINFPWKNYKESLPAAHFMGKDAHRGYYSRMVVILLARSVSQDRACLRLYYLRSTFLSFLERSAVAVILIVRSVLTLRMIGVHDVLCHP